MIGSFINKNYICITIVKKRMEISRKENQELFEVLFERYQNYEKWASVFNKEFIPKAGVVAGVLTPSMLIINDSLIDDFTKWLKTKGIIIKQRRSI